MDNDRKQEINNYLCGVRSGDRESLSRLHKALSATVWHIAFKYLHNKDDADDLAQDFWLNIRKIANGFRLSKNAFAYLCQVVSRMAINRFHKLNKTERAEARFVDYSRLECNVHIDEKVEIDDALDRAISKLGERDGRIFQLAYFEDKTVREIAKEVNLSKSQVSVILNQSKDKIKSEIFDYFVDKPDV